MWAVCCCVRFAARRAVLVADWCVLCCSLFYSLCAVRWLVRVVWSALCDVHCLVGVA